LYTTGLNRRCRQDILLNVFLAIAVDNLGDAEEADEQEEAAKAAERTSAAEAQVGLYIQLYSP